jgi:gamma-glutamylcyclotransferase (GGCT)/AIG2-like uncharacterized protein YtfP
MTEIFFVYGTLKRRMKNHGIIEKLKGKFISEAISTYKFPMFDLGNPFPYLQNTKGKGKIINGELFEIPKNKIKDLDYFEGVPDLYKKGTIEVNGNKVNCYFITDELTEEELSEIKTFNEWVE